MTLKRRLDRLQRKTPEFYADVAEIPTPVLEAMLRRSLADKHLTKEQREITHVLRDTGIEL